MKLAIFPNTEGRISVIVPAPNCGLTLEQICAKEVPTGIKYKIINSNDLPPDRDFRNAWEYDFSTDFDGVGA